MSKFRPIAHLSSWRRVALHAWRPPSDPTVYGTLDIDVHEALGVVSELREQSGVKVTLTHLVGRALALAIRERPEMNAIVRFGTLYQRDTIDIFFQIATEGGEDLAGHKVERIDEKTVVEIARALGTGVTRTRRGDSESGKTAKMFRSVPAPLVGALIRASTFVTYDLGLDLRRFGVPQDGFGSAMITNVGPFGLTSGHAPLLPFTRCPLLLLVGEVSQRAVVREGAVVARPILPIGVTFDHRLLDGYQAGVLARRFREVLETPRKALAAELRAKGNGHLADSPRDGE